MLYFCAMLLTILMPSTFLQAEHLEEGNSQQIKLQKCLMEYWGVDSHTTLFLCQYFKPFEVKESTELVQTLQESSMVKHSHLIEENEMKTFEKSIAYFFGVRHEKPVIEAYMNALEKLTIESKSIELLEKEMLPHLENAYQSIKQQRNWEFDPHLAAKIEFQIILGNFKHVPFEVVQDLMIQLYQVVFQSDSPLIQKAARLRTFLYQYKAKVLEIDGQFTEEDRRVMLEIAIASKNLLNSIRS